MTSPTSTMTVTSVSASGANDIDSLLAGVKWGNVGPGAAIAYSFPYANGPAVWATSYGSSENEPNTASGLGSLHQAAVRQALQKWADVANLSLIETVETSTNVGDIRFAYTSTPAISPWWGWSGYPNAYWPSGGDVWVNAARAADDWSAGSSQFSALLHEIGHALGLKHPFAGTPVLPLAEDTEQYTLMSYTDHPHALFRDVVDHGGGSYSWTFYSVSPQTPMLYDIAAIQYLYGANTSYHSGDDTYTFAPDSPFFMTLWDAGGSDTISVSNFTKGCTIDLRAGCFSHITIESDPLPPGTSGMAPTYDGTDNLAIAFGVTIENAIGGSGNDLLTGNSANNRLEGGAGSDSLQGGDGTDTAVFSGSFAGYHLSYSAGLITVTDTRVADGNDGTDTLTHFETLRFADREVDGLRYIASYPDLISAFHTDAEAGLNHYVEYGICEGRSINFDSAFYLARYPDLRAAFDANLDAATRHYVEYGFIEGRIASNAGDDLLNGSNSADTLNGGAGRDALTASAGDDALIGGTGNDTLSGGSGSDDFVFNAALDATLSVDTLTDFTPGSDRIVLDHTIFAALPAGSLGAGNLVAEAGAVAHDGDDFLLYDTRTGNLAYDPDGSGAAAATLFATLSDHPALAVLDVWVG